MTILKKIPATLHRRALLVPVLAATLLSIFAGAHANPEDGSGGLQAVLEMHSTLLSEGDPIEVRFSIWNAGSKAVKALPEAPLARHFRLLDANGSQIPMNKEASAGAPNPSELPPGGHYGIAFDLGPLFPEMREPGTYRLSWSSGALESNNVVIKIIPKYDSEKAYVAKIETSQGDVTLEFFPKEAPNAVRNFIELANLGFYDGTRIHRVEADRMIVGGDRGGAGSGIPGYTIPFERTDLQMLAGTVGFKKAGVPPTNGSVFFILAGPRPELRGQFTAFAQVVNGLDIVRKISRSKHTGSRSATPNMPLDPIVIKKVGITEKTRG